jgi:hypothetical protein
VVAHDSVRSGKAGTLSLARVVFSVGMSLDGFIAPEGMDLAHADDPQFNDWLAQWMELQNGCSSSGSSANASSLGKGETPDETFGPLGHAPCLLRGARLGDGGDAATTLGHDAPRSPARRAASERRKSEGSGDRRETRRFRLGHKVPSPEGRRTSSRRVSK